VRSGGWGVKGVKLYTAEPDVSDAVLAALDSVRDPELDTSIVELGFVTSCHVDDDGTARVRLRLPT
jgi:metal-sulfur cluster biosynthetic enzyme